MRHANDGQEFPVHDGTETPIDDSESAGLISQMIAMLLHNADEPPKEVGGVSEEFCDSKLPSHMSFSVCGRSRDKLTEI